MDQDTFGMMSLLVLVVVLIILVICLNTRTPHRCPEKYTPRRKSPVRRVERYEETTKGQDSSLESKLYNDGVIEDVSTFASSLQSPDNVQNQISEQIEQINQEQTEEAAGFYNTNTNQYINEMETQNRLNRIYLQNLSSPGVRDEQNEKITTAIMTYDGFENHVPETFESYLLRPSNNCGTMRQQVVLVNQHGFGSLYSGQYLGPQRIKNPVKTVNTNAAQVVSNGVTDSIAMENTQESGEATLSEAAVKNNLENTVTATV